MKILMLSTYMTGGASIAALRLCEALKANYPDIEVNVLTRKGANGTWIHTLEGISKLKGEFAFYADRFMFTRQERDKSVRWAYSMADIGVDISKHPLVKEADVLHLHWIHHGFLSMRSLKKLIALGKPIIWTMHDMWTFTGGCHYAGTCTNFEKNCGNCMFLKTPKEKDISYKLLNEKLAIIAKHNIQFITPSDWLRKEALKSNLLSNEAVFTIPNALDINVFKPISNNKLRIDLGIANDKKVILFLAMSAEDKRKGFEYLKQALQQLHSKENADKYEILVLGKGSEEMLQGIPFKAHLLGVINGKEKITEVYNAVDVFVIPSLEDNLPNTIMESLACGKPCVGFNSGGIPEMIDHKINGYIAGFKDVADLAKGIQWVLDEVELSAEVLSQNALNKVKTIYANPVVAKLHMDLYGKMVKG